ncbi:hypothetical protein [Ancylobacter lacus]|uniref:hypothetical protein n=1 Tax=Ancylobacter lacus TaxID=2579970 RepID=UPI001BCF6ABD|nr:hypothetical protein [Ancylobacter lacus]MBS7537750.1 hypothetical protein [Ancylobacter lacus]
MAKQPDTKHRLYYSDRHGVRVSGTYLRTRHKDQALAPVTSLHVGRDPLHVALACGLGLALFALQFGDLLYMPEQLGLVGLGMAILVGGYSIATLEMGSYRHESRVLWGSYWRMLRIRDAIIEARQDRLDVEGMVLAHTGEDDNEDNG